MYAYMKQVHPPTGIEMCEFCHFFNMRQKNLLVAGTTQLQVFNLVPVDDPTGGTDEGGGVKSASAIEVLQQHRDGKCKLECAASFSFFGNVTSMKSVKLSGSPRDMLLLTFLDAKLSIVEYDPTTHDLKTISLHCFEEDELRGGRNDFSAELPLVRVDPQDRCAVMLCYGTKLVVLPFRKDDLGGDADSSIFDAASASGSALSLPGMDGSGLGANESGNDWAQGAMQSYIIDVRELDEQIINVIDYQFLYGYYEPTLFILFEPLRTWGGRVAVRQDTCAIAAISLNITQKVS
jgi:cleavage and polyadenylation specificity factor subunit 1